jgi:putative transposase
MKRFTSPGHAQRFLSAFSGISPHFRPRRHLLSAADYRQVMAGRFAVWNHHRDDDHGRRLNRRLGQVFPPEPTHNTQTIDPNHQAHQLT